MVEATTKIEQSTDPAEPRSETADPRVQATLQPATQERAKPVLRIPRCNC